MIDIHHHLLFGLDDGPSDIEISVAMAEMSIQNGVTHIVCTPHSSEHFKFDPALNLERLEMIRQRLGDRISLGLGCDFHLMFDNIEDAIANPAKYSINGKQVFAGGVSRPRNLPEHEGDLFSSEHSRADLDHHSSRAQPAARTPP